MRIKKKAEAIPFRETPIYRLILITGSVALFIATMYNVVASVRASDTPILIASSVAAALALFTTFYNMSHLKHARISPAAMKKMKRRI